MRIEGNVREMQRWRPGIRPQVVLFDLDGTITDSAPGINASMKVALQELGLEVPTDDVLRSFVGPRFSLALESLGHSPEVIAQVVAAYRRDYTAGRLFQTELYPGFETLVQELSTRGIRVAVATSKPQETARRIIGHFGLEKYFSGGLDGVFGADLHDRIKSKAEVIAPALAALEVTPGSDVVMVGDRLHDVEGAAANGIACIGVSWGYAAPGELEQAGAVMVVDEMTQLANALLSVSAN